MRIALLYGALTGVAVALVAMAAYLSHRRTQFDVVDNALRRSAQQVVVKLASARVAADGGALLSRSLVADASIRVFDIHGALIGQSTNSATVPPFRVCAVRLTTNEQCLAVRRAGDAGSSRATAYQVVRDSLGARWRVHVLAVDDGGRFVAVTMPLSDIDASAALFARWMLAIAIGGCIAVSQEVVLIPDASVEQIINVNKRHPGTTCKALASPCIINRRPTICQVSPQSRLTS